MSGEIITRCTSSVSPKRCYPTEADAKEKARAMKRQYKQRFYHYFHHACQHWHITRQAPRSEPE